MVVGQSMDLIMNTKLSELFITGCDKNTRWMLPWFEDNFYKHNPNAKLHVYDFDKEFNNEKGWFKKPRAMFEACNLADNVCWLDSDIEVRENVENIFEFTEPNKLAMVQDQPWSTRRGETWHNSGVVAFKSTPSILIDWVTATAMSSLHDLSNPMFGDQDVLHSIVKEGMKRLIHITDLPKAYNTLRLDLDDGTIPNKIKMMHWTGHKGKDIIRSLINE